MFVDGGATMSAAAREALAPNARLEPRRLDMGRVARECDVAVLHAAQGATAAVLLAGKPILQIPTVLEQRLTAEATARLGAGETASPGAGADELAAKLDALASNPGYSDAARTFARSYGDFDPLVQVERMAGRIEALAEERAAGAAPVFAG